MRKFPVDSTHFWKDVMSRHNYIGLDGHNTIHDSMAYKFVMHHYPNSNVRYRAKIMQRISEHSKEIGWQAFRKLKKKLGQPLYRGGPEPRVEWVSTNPSGKGEHFIRETGKRWNSISNLEEEMQRSQLRNIERQSFGWLSREQREKLEKLRPEVDGKKAIEHKAKEQS